MFKYLTVESLHPGAGLSHWDSCFLNENGERVALVLPTPILG